MFIILTNIHHPHGVFIILNSFMNIHKPHKYSSFFEKYSNLILVHNIICIFVIVHVQLVLPATDDTINRLGDLEGLQLQMSKVTVTNCRSDEGKASRSELHSTLSNFDKSRLFGTTAMTSTRFPNESGDPSCIHDRFRNHVDQIDDGYDDKFVESLLRGKTLADESVSDKVEEFIKSSTATNSSGSSYYGMTTDSFRLEFE